MQEAPTSLFSLGQVIKVRVVSADAARRRIVVCEHSAPAHEPKKEGKKEGKEAKKSASEEQEEKESVVASGTEVSGTIAGVEGEGTAAVFLIDLRSVFFVLFLAHL